MEDYHFPVTPKAHPEAIISGPNYRFTILTDKLFRYEWSHDGHFEDRASTFAINRQFPVPKFHKTETEDELEIIGDHFHISYDKKRFSPRGLLASFPVKISLWGSQWRYSEDDEGRNLGGTARTLDDIDGRTDMGGGVASRLGYATIDDSTSMLFDGKGFVAGRQPGDRIDGYLFCYGLDYKEAVRALYAVSGKQPVLPRWSLGNWWSRYYRYTQDEYLGLMDEFERRKIPFSVAVIDMDWHLVRDDRVPHAGWTGYTWDDKLFPDPVAFGRELHKRKLKISLNDHPHSGVHHHEDSYEEMAKAIGHDTSRKPPILFDPTSPKFMHAYLNILHRNIEKVACDFWWIDWQQGSHTKVPGIDPLWMLNHFHFIDNGKTGQQPIVFSRYAGPGSHRYPVGFSGDTITTWASLEFQPEFTATASNIGYGWWSHDIGGHMFGSRDDELVTRWVQLGVFSPIMRLHSTNSRWMSKEPWLYRKENEVIMQKFLQFRHRLIPYLFSQNVLLSSKDEPLVQPMYWSYPERNEAYSVPNQFFFGTEMIVAPIVTPRDKKTNLGSVKAWLPPKSHHVDIFTGIVYDGNRELKIFRSLDQIPVLAPGGSIICLDANKTPGNGGVNPDAFEILIVVGEDGEFSILEDPADDPNNHDAEKISNPKDLHVKKTEPKSICDIRYSQSQGTLTAKIHNISKRRQWTFRFLALDHISPDKPKVYLNDQKSNPSSTGITISTTNYPEVPSLVVEYTAPTTSSSDDLLTISIDLATQSPQLNIQDHRPRIEQLLKDFQIEFGTKERIWDAIAADSTTTTAAGTLNVTINNLLTTGIEEELVGPIMELILADRRGYTGV